MERITVDQEQGLTALEPLPTVQMPDAFYSTLGDKAKAILQTTVEENTVKHYEEGEEVRDVLCRYFSIRYHHPLNEEVDLAAKFAGLGKLFNYWVEKDLVVGGILGGTPMMIEMAAHHLESDTWFDLKSGIIMPTKLPKEMKTFSGSAEDSEKLLKGFTLEDVDPATVQCRKLFCMYIFPHPDIQDKIDKECREAGAYGWKSYHARLNEAMGLSDGFAEEGRISDMVNWQFLESL
jgi:hypothetical protein